MFRSGCCALQGVKGSDVLFLSGSLKHIEATIKSIQSSFKDQQIVVAVCKDAKLDELQVCTCWHNTSTAWFHVTPVMHVVAQYWTTADTCLTLCIMLSCMSCRPWPKKTMPCCSQHTFVVHIEWKDTGNDDSIQYRCVPWESNLCNTPPKTAWQWQWQLPYSITAHHHMWRNLRTSSFSMHVRIELRHYASKTRYWQLTIKDGLVPLEACASWRPAHPVVRFNKWTSCTSLLTEKAPTMVALCPGAAQYRQKLGIGRFQGALKLTSATCWSRLIWKTLSADFDWQDYKAFGGSLREWSTVAAKRWQSSIRKFDLCRFGLEKLQSLC